MLKLKKIHILGFKSFCDRTELTVPGTGIATVVGPNGCGKSNILDGISWVLGEQSAKSLRGTHMQDVIFAGTRERKALGMAEVTLTMVDPEAYEGPVAVEPEVVVEHDGPADWDEDEVRRRRAAEAEEIIANEQPGQVLEDGQAAGDEGAEDSQATSEGPQAVVLKIRRRRFHRTPQKGEIVITRRLFRTGESEYLLNGKLCRLRDIQDIFMGTGLGPESYAIIGQERIGQLLSSKPHDRRAIIEEAAGITRFKTKKRLAELRLESARQNLARVDDIFEEVTRQMNSLKRQAAKAERFAAVRDELRGRLRVVLASRMALMDADQARLEEEIASLSGRVNEAVEVIAQQEASQHSLTEHGYALDREGQEAQERANQAAVELERATARERSNTERVAELETRIAAAGTELEQTRTQLAGIAEERAQHRSFLEICGRRSSRFSPEGGGAPAGSARRGRRGFHRRAAIGERPPPRDASAHAGRQRAQPYHARLKRAWPRWSARRSGCARRLARHATSRRRWAWRAGRRTCVSSPRPTRSSGLKAKSQNCARSLQTRRAEESAQRTLANQLRGEQASVAGRRDSLEALIRNHSYSTDSVRKLLKPGALGAWQLACWHAGRFP